MGRLRMLVFGTAVLALAACSSLQHLTTGSAGEAKSAAAAELAYTEVAKAETIWLGSGQVTKGQAKVAKALDAAVYADVVAAREAVANNDSAAVAIALQLFNQALPALKGYVGGSVGQR